MSSQLPRFKLSHQAVLMALLAATAPVTAYGAAAGRADFVVGAVEIVSSDGNRRPLAKGGELVSGDSINTSSGGRAQLHFVDGGYVSLQPNTLFRVDEFNYANKADGNERGFFSLLKGGFRAITGAIGHVNRNTYRVTTPNATIGIRGTGYKTEIRDDGLFVSVGEGAVSLTNNTGVLVVTSGGSAFVTNINTPPVTTNEQANAPAASVDPHTEVATILIPTIPTQSLMPSGPGYVMSYAFMMDSSYGRTGALTAVDAVFSTSSQLQQYLGTPASGLLRVAIGLSDSGDLGTAAVTFSANDGTIGWGRWVGGFNTTIATPAAAPLDIFHYAIGVPTPTMPTAGGATYSLLGYSSPTATDSSTGYSLAGTSLSVDFGMGALDVNLAITNGTNTYALTIPASINGTTFSGNTWTWGGNCFSCSADVAGFFAGANASRAGLTYEVNDLYGQSGPRTLQGAAAFTSDGLTATAPNVSAGF